MSESIKINSDIETFRTLEYCKFRGVYISEVFWELRVWECSA